MSRKTMSVLAAAVAASLAPSLTYAVVDGTVTGGEYTQTLATQTTGTGFGNNFSELNQAFANYTPGGTLGLALTGNLEGNGNGLIIFIDSKAGGGIANSSFGANQFGSVAGARVDDWGTDTDGGAPVGATPGGASIVSPNFNPDYAIEINAGGGGANYYTNIIDLTQPNDDTHPNKDVFLGANTTGGPAVNQTYFRNAGADASGSITHAFNNSNTAGVSDTDASTANTATTGFEYEFDNTFLGYVQGHAVTALALITSGDGGYLSNQFLPGLPNNTGNLGNAFAGHPLFDARNWPNGTDFEMTIFEPTRSTGGVWSTTGAWTGAFAPNGVEHAAALVGSAATTITLDSNVSLGSLKFSNAAGYTLTGSTLTFNAAPGAARLLTFTGNHTINSPVVLNTDLRIDNASGSSVTIASLTNSATKTIVKVGAGTLTISSQVNSLGANLDVQQGTANINGDGGSAAALNQNVFIGSSSGSSTAVANFNASQHLNQLFVNPSSSAVLSAGGKLIVTRDLGVGAGGKLNITDGKLIVKNTPAVGTWTGTNYDGITGLIASGRNGGGWGGSGIVTSQSTATSGNLTTIGVATAAQVKGIAATATAVFAGQTVSGTDTLVMYTYGGDANLDGKINVDDYTRIDFNVPLGTRGWYNGDFNYDGKINVDDYTIIDFNVGIQGAPFPTGAGDGLSGVAAVPEPASMSILALGAAAALRRRRRR